MSKNGEDAKDDADMLDPFTNSENGLGMSSRSQSYEGGNCSSISELWTKDNLTIYRHITLTNVENPHGAITFDLLSCPLKLQDQLVALGSSSKAVQLLDILIINDLCGIIGIDGCNNEFQF